MQLEGGVQFRSLLCTPRRNVNFANSFVVGRGVERERLTSFYY